MDVARAAVQVKAALEALPESFRLPVLLADVEEFSYKEIAEMLEIPIGTVMSRLSRARSRLRELLDAPAGDLAARPTAIGAPMLRRLK